MGKGPQKAEKQAARQLSQQEMEIMRQLAQQQQQLFGQGGGLLGQGLGFFQRLISGDRQAMMQAAAPAAQQLALQTEQTIRQLQQQMPRGGAEQLAEAQTRIQEGANIGNLLAQAYTQAFPGVMQAGLSEMGLSPQYAFGASQAGSVAGQAIGQLAQAEAMGGEAKAQVLGQLAGVGGYLGGVAMGAPSSIPMGQLLLNLPLPQTVPPYIGPPSYGPLEPPTIGPPAWPEFPSWLTPAPPPAPLGSMPTQQFGTGGF
jgi:hypothetical protein